MAAMWLLLLVPVLLALSLGALWALRAFRWAPVVSRRVLVHVDGETLSGILVSRRGPLLFLADAAVFVDGESQSIDGQVVVERPRVSWMQVVS